MIIQEINRQIVARLTHDYAMNPAGNHLRGGKCPECGKKTLWTWLEKPGAVQCDRVGKCGFFSTTKELYPELFGNLNKRYQPTPEDPNKTANAYIDLVRGFPHEQLSGWYEQGKYWNPNADKGTATVRFWLDEAKTVYWERFIEDVTITSESGEIEVRNSGFKGSFKGLWWQPPAQAIHIGDTVYITEGIFKAIALVLSGYKAVSIMSAGSFPEDAFKTHYKKDINWVMALDNDEAGRKFTKKHVKFLRAQRETVTCILSAENTNKLDWDDLYKAKKLTAQDMAEYRHLGALEIASNVQAKALEIWKHNPTQSYFCTTFKNKTYAVELDEKEYNQEKQHFLEPDPGRDENEAIAHAFASTVKINAIASFTMEFLYLQISQETQERQYFFRIRYANGSPESLHAFKGRIFGAASDFTKAVLDDSNGAQFTGDKRALFYLFANWLKDQPKIVKTIDFIGYDADTSTYVFADYAVENDKLITLNSESYFTLKKSAIKSAHNLKQELTTTPPVDFFPDYRLAFGQKGVIVLAWWLGSLFAEQIRHTHRSYPFLEVYGEAGSGKSDMIDFLWKLLGRKSTTFNPNNSTMPGRMRKMAEVSNLPVVFNETDNDTDAEKGHLKKFTWEENKDLFEGEFGRATGVKTNDNSTRLPLFRGSMMALQNPKITGSEAIISRFITINFDRAHHSYNGKAASDRLNVAEIKQFSGFLLNTLQKTSKILKLYQDRFAVHMRTLQKNPAIKMQRIMQNHAQLLALTDCLALVCTISADEIKKTQDLIITLAIAKEEERNEDHAVVQQFWANFDYLDTQATTNADTGNTYLQENLQNHSNTPESEIAINIEDFLKECERANLPRLPPSDLRKYLPTSKTREFKENKVVNSRLQKRSLRCYVFYKGKKPKANKPN